MSLIPDSTRAGLPTGTVTFLFTDIEGSTRLWQEKPGAMSVANARHDVILRQAIEANKGTVFQLVGDSFAAAFHNASDGLRAALSAQRGLQAEPWGETGAIRVRMGLHTGAAEIAGDGSNKYPEGYATIASTQRVMSAAHGGQVLISQTTHDLLQNDLPEDVALRDLGEHRLKDLRSPLHLYQLTAPGLPGDFPAIKSLKFLPSNLPVQLTRFVGREKELAELERLLSGTRLLTLTGPGGTGKTRLSLQLAGSVLGKFPQGVWLVELAPLADPGLVLQTVAASIGLREIPGVALKNLVIDHLRERQVLLILDNCEHLVEACALLSDQLIRSCSNLKVIASSREALGIAGETIYRVPPLALPDSENPSTETVRSSEAVQLFVERAAAVKTSFSVTDSNARAIAQICQRLDGIPLALELAAARVGVLTPQQIATRLDDRFRLLTGGSRTALPRQQTLRSLIDWSYDLLSASERTLFCRLAVFVGGWSLEAAEAVCPEMDVLELLAELVQKSLVVAEEREDPATTRFQLLETIRQYARDRLLETEGVAQVRNLHLAYYLKLAEAGEPNFYGPQRLEWVDQFEIEHDNFRAALQWGLEYDVEAALRLAGSMVIFWSARGYTTEGHHWLQAALDRFAAMPELDGEGGRRRQAVQAKGLIGIAQMTYGDADYKSGLHASQEAVRLYRQLGDPFGLGFALSAMGNMAAFQNDMALAEQALLESIQVGRESGNKLVLCYALGVFSRYIALPRGDIDTARSYAEESAHFSREIQLPWAEALAELVLARIATIQGQWDEARRGAEAAIKVSRQLRDPFLLNQAITELGDIELCSGNVAEAQQHYRQSIVALQELGQRAFVAHGLESLAFIAQANNQPDRAARLLGAAEALREGIGTSVFGVERLTDEYERAVAWLHAQLDDHTYQSCWDEGCSMTADRAIAYALEP